MQLHTLEKEGRLPTGYDLWQGATKIAITNPALDYVIKIPLYMEDCPEEDYCEYENYYYTFAVQAGVENFFVPNTYIGVVDGINVYTQPFCEIIDFDAEEYNDDSLINFETEKD